MRSSLVTTARRAKTALVAGIIANLALLGFFKYFNFFADSFVNIVELFGGHVTWTTANIVLPIGISFFTFQKIAYLIDIRRKHFEPSRTLLTFASFVAYFPQLVAGPIERAPHLYKQFVTPRKITAEGLKTGSLLFLWGMYKKVVIADNLAPITNDIFSRFPGVDGSAYVVGGLAMSVMKSHDVVVVPIRSGVGLRAGINVGYLKFTNEPTWNPF